MAKRRSRSRRANGNDGDEQEHNGNDEEVAPDRRRLRADVRDRQRAVAEREASRLARPEVRRQPTLDHADRKKSAVSSTPFGVLAKASDAIPTGTTDATWCGPFSVARQMIAQREEARRQREAEQEEENGTAHPLDAVMKEVDMEKKRKAHPSLLWKGSIPAEAKTTAKSSLYAKRQKRADIRAKGQGGGIPSLFQLCVNFVVENFEHVESLGATVDNSVRAALCHELIQRGQMHGTSLETIAEAGMEGLELVDCSQITPDELQKALTKLLPCGLRYLVLDQAGRCFGHKAVNAIIDYANQSSLFALAIGGAYSFKDDDGARLIQAIAKTVSSLDFKACNLLGINTCQALANSYATTGKLLELSMEDVTLTEDSLVAVISKPDALKHIKSLTLRRIDGLTDDIVTKFVSVVGGTLEGLDLGENQQLTDLTLSSVRQSCGALRGLRLDGLRLLTGAGLEAFFTFVPNMNPPPVLHTLDLGKCDYEAVTDNVIQLITQAATTKRDSKSPGGEVSLMGGLVSLNIQGSALVTDIAMEYIASSCSTSLQDLNVSFCPKVTDQGLGYLVDKMSPQLGRVDVWGNAQLTDTLFDGNSRSDDPSLEFVGVWMKKSTDRVIR